jgi:uncharacterized OB-fold protein
MSVKRIPVAEGLFVDSADEPRLLGSRCTNCNIPYFPKSAVCHNPDCTNSTIEDASFGPRGKIWSCARQDYEPPAPVQYDKPFEPYAMAIVDLDDGLRVLGRIATDDPLSVAPDMDVELVVAPLAHDEDGNEIVSWQFRIV